MASRLTWIDHDDAARTRSLRILLLFQEKESLDELGLGAIRDTFADILFPGTSTIQTRLRYFLFIPWIYKELENHRVEPPHFAKEARKKELGLISPLLKKEKMGIIGKVAGFALKQLASSAYWNGLKSWGIRLIPYSQDEYHRYISQIYRHRDSIRGRYKEDGGSGPEILTWHPRLPEPPKGFPDKLASLSFDLEPNEADFLQDRIVESHAKSLLAHLALHPSPILCDFPWQHPGYAEFTDAHKTILRYAEFFSTIMRGAAYLYNLMLAEMAGRKELEGEHRDRLVEWKTGVLQCRNRDLPLDGLWELAVGQEHTITMRTKEFVRAWVHRVRALRGDVADDNECRRLIYSREKRLKGVWSRFTNSRARDQWKGHAGINPMDYRWSQVKKLLTDLYKGLARGDHAES